MAIKMRGPAFFKKTEQTEHGLTHEDDDDD
jgi:hypothetical protein